MIYFPNFELECYLCGATPTVEVNGHAVPETRLCGAHFFDDPQMHDHHKWNRDKREEDNEQ